MAALTAKATREYIDALRVTAAAAAMLKVREIRLFVVDRVAWMEDVTASMAAVPRELASVIASCCDDVCACILG